MRVLIVNPRIYVYGGAELLIVRLANYLTDKGIKNALLTTSIIPEVQTDLKGTDIIIKDKPMSNVIGEILALNKGVRDNLNNFDVINVHNFPAEFSIFPYNKPVVWMCNEPELYLSLKLNPPFGTRLLYRSLWPFDKFVVRFYIKNIAVSDIFNANRFRNLYRIVPHIINYGIDYKFFAQGEPEKAIKRFRLFNDFVVIQVGMLTPFKNQIESIKTVERLKLLIPNIKLVLAGEGEFKYRSMLEKYIQERNLSANVIFAGHLKREELRDLYHACHVLLHPVKSQGGWLSPFEALCARKPIVVSTEMTASDIIKNEKIGIVTDNFDEAIIDIYKNPDKYNEMADKGERWVRDNLSWDMFCEKMLGLFYKAMNKNK
ncbi:MAG: glycosyltransferase family 4 protein [Proteobacteria bacterium]|nr:glycosyltransferase family 4 protein [Desulfobacteraceae bacterium]MBU4420988.1 glycosyltransferase family 4 protein [Pseudomonadota bacterium]MCG2758059.1 glycosyltransferase family 4 protein [Desulfobacteraceae bacterium]MCG2829903.1 glycosyltransferase family 4 protein [Desulfobacteraceae bacterium]